MAKTPPLFDIGVLPSYQVGERVLLLEDGERGQIVGTGDDGEWWNVLADDDAESPDELARLVEVGQLVCADESGSYELADELLATTVARLRLEATAYARLWLIRNAIDALEGPALLEEMDAAYEEFRASAANKLADMKTQLASVLPAATRREQLSWLIEQEDVVPAPPEITSRIEATASQILSERFSDAELRATCESFRTDANRLAQLTGKDPETLALGLFRAELVDRAVAKINEWRTHPSLTPTQAQILSKWWPRNPSGFD